MEKESYVFPFNNILSLSQLSTVLLGNDYDVSGFSNNTTFNSINYLADAAEDSWKSSPESSMYVTLDELNRSSTIPSPSFSLLQINYWSLPKNFDSLTDLLSSMDKKPDIIAVSETWLTGINDCLYDLPNYTFESLPRIQNRRVEGSVFTFLAVYHIN